MVMDGATIVAVDSGWPPPADAHVVDLGSAALLPRLVDSHVH
jgi:dihydroorotase-like cyclic amidohydrolase